MPAMRRPNKRARKILERILGVSPSLRDSNYSQKGNTNSSDKRHRLGSITPNYFGKGY